MICDYCEKDKEKLKEEVEFIHLHFSCWVEIEHSLRISLRKLERFNNFLDKIPIEKLL